MNVIYSNYQNMIIDGNVNNLHLLSIRYILYENIAVTPYSHSLHYRFPWQVIVQSYSEDGNSNKCYPVIAIFWER